MNGCIESPLSKKRGGYARKNVGSRIDGSAYITGHHRVAYAEANGLTMADIKGMVVMHLCDNPPCINPDHLRLGTQADNLADMTTKGRRKNSNSLKTHCIRGHEFSDENTYVWGGMRRCRKCAAMRDRTRRDARKPA